MTHNAGSNAPSKLSRKRATPRFDALHASSARASAAARGSSRKRDTKCELALRRVLWRQGARYRVDVTSLPGRPDLVFPRERLAVFCDGDFWHGRDLQARLERLATGHNAPYWLAKIRTNVERDHRHEAALIAEGWHVLRLWETDIMKDTPAAAERVLHEIASLRSTGAQAKL